MCFYNKRAPQGRKPGVLFDYTVLNRAFYLLLGASHIGDEAIDLLDGVHDGDHVVDDGAAGGGAAGGNPFEGFDFSSFGGGGGGFSSFFENLFGGGRARGSQGAGFGGFGGFGGAGAGFGAGAEYGTGGCNGGCGGHSARTNTGEMNMNVNIDMYTALLGGEGIITLSNGSKIKLKIKPETQNGTKVRVRGKGYDRGDGTFGDLMITYNVKLPTGLNEKQKELLRQMKEAK